MGIAIERGAKRRSIEREKEIARAEVCSLFAGVFALNKALLE